MHQLYKYFRTAIVVVPSKSLNSQTTENLDGYSNVIQENWTISFLLRFSIRKNNTFTAIQL